MSVNEEKNFNCIEIEPAGVATKSVIWLHGLGADGSDFVPIIPELHLPSTLNIRFVFPHAPVMPVTVNNGYHMRAWYDIFSVSLDSKIDTVGMTKSIAYVEKLITRENERGIKTNNIMLAGFSQGAVIALLTALRYSETLGGVIALSGYLPLPHETLQTINDANRHLPIFIAHGQSDPIVSYALGKAAYVALHDAGFPVSWHSYPMPHSVCPTEIQDLSKWMGQIWR